MPDAAMRTTTSSAAGSASSSCSSRQSAWLDSTTAAVICKLLRRQARVAHDLAELVILARDERVGFGGRHGHRLGAELGEALLHLLALQRAVHLAVQLRHDLGRRPGR